MDRTDLWKYCSAEQCREMMLSFRLIGAGDWPPEKIMGCLYALSNHAEKHYQRVNIPKRSGGFRTLLVPDPLLKNVQRNLLHHVLDGLQCPTARRLTGRGLRWLPTQGSIRAGRLS